MKTWRAAWRAGLPAVLCLVISLPAAGGPSKPLPDMVGRAGEQPAGAVGGARGSARGFGGVYGPLASTAGVTQERPAGLGRLLERVQQRYDGIRDLRARFVQRRAGRFGTPDIVHEGRLFVRNPGRMRWEYERPKQLFVVTGEEMYLYLPEDNQVQVFQPDGSEPLRVPTLYLSGEGDLLRDFEASPAEWGPPLDSGNVQVRLEPRQPGSLPSLVMEIRPMSATIVRIVQLDRVGNDIEYRFEDVEFDVGLPDSLFGFEVPAGAEVIYVGG